MPVKFEESNGITGHQHNPANGNGRLRGRVNLQSEGTVFYGRWAASYSI